MKFKLVWDPGMLHECEGETVRLPAEIFRLHASELKGWRVLMESQGTRKDHHINNGDCSYVFQVP